MSSNSGNPEHRNFVRLTSFSIGVEIIGIEAQGDFQAVRDISQGGVRFTVNERFSPGGMLDLVLMLPGDETSIHAQVEVVWSEQFHENGPYEVGCRFLRIDPIHHGKIIHYIHNILKERRPLV